MTSNHSTFQALCDLVQAEMERRKVPGLALGVLKDDQEWVQGFGVTSVENPLAVTPGTLFQVGSITKTFTATLAMLLVEEGRLDLDTPVRCYLPDLRLAGAQVAGQVTMRHLLTHTCGWQGDYFEDFGWGDDALATMVQHLKELPQETPLGQVWSYNNSAFYLAGRVIEALSGTSYEAALQERLIAPLGLENAFFSLDDILTRRFAVGHQIEGDQAKVARPWAVPRSAAPAGGLVTNVPELLRYARFHMGDGTVPGSRVRLLSQASLRTMQTPVCDAAWPNQIGLSWFITNLPGARWIGHGGGTNGQVSDFGMVPEQQFAVVLLANAGRMGVFFRKAVRFALQQFLGLALPEPQPQPADPALLEQYVGRYDGKLETLCLTLEDGELQLALQFKGGYPKPDSPPPPPIPPSRVALFAEDKAVALDDPLKDMTCEFLRDANGQVASVRFSGRVRLRLPAG